MYKNNNFNLIFTKTGRITLILSIFESLKPLVKRVIMLLVIMTQIRNYIRVAASESHNSLYLFEALREVLFSLLIFACVIPILHLVVDRLELKKLRTFKIEKKEVPWLLLRDVNVFERLSRYIFSLVISILVLYFWAAPVSAYSLVLSQPVAFIWAYIFSLKILPHFFRHEFFKYDFIEYIGFSSYILILCGTLYRFDGGVYLDISHIFLFIVVPRVLFKYQMSAVRCLI